MPLEVKKTACIQWRTQETDIQIISAFSCLSLRLHMITCYTYHNRVGLVCCCLLSDILMYMSFVAAVSGHSFTQHFD